MNFTLLAPLGVAFLLCGWASLLRAIEGSWLAPGAFFALWWALAATFPLIVAPEEPVSITAMGWVLAASIAVGLGSIAGAGRPRTPAPTRPLDRVQRRWLWAAFGVATILGLGSNLTFVTGHGVSPSELFSLQGLLAFATMATSERYAMEAPPRLSQALLPFVFLGPMLGGILFGESRSRSRFQALWGLLPGMLIAVTQTAKAGTIFAGLLFVAGYCTAQVRWHRYHLLSWRRVGLALAVVLAFTAFMYFVTLSRGGQLDPALLEVANLKLRSALVGHMAVFSDWLQGYPQNTPDPSWGKYTFAGPAEALGLTTRIGGLFETTYFLSFGESSNIYTVFRPLIQDFTIPGALAFLLLLGLAGGAGYRAVGHGKWWAAPLLLIFYAVTIDSPITSLLAYNSQIAATGALAAVLLLTPYLPGRWPSRWLRRKPYQPLVGVNEGFRRGNRGHSA